MHGSAFPISSRGGPGRRAAVESRPGAERFAGQRLLLIGGSYSAEDIGIQSHKMGARQVTMSYRSGPQGFAWPQSVDEKPQVESIDGTVATFVDGTAREFDAIIMCTGYLHHYPFLPRDLHLESPNNLYPEGLYRGVTWQQNPQLHYLGAQDQWFTFNMFDAQAWFVRDLILGRIETPSEDERLAHINEWLDRYAKVDDDPAAVRFQADYIRDLIEQTDYPMFDLDEVVRIFLAWKKDKKSNILTYRDQVYTSVMTGTTSIVHHTPWLEELDDSRERYLSIENRADAVRDPVM